MDIINEILDEIVNEISNSINDIKIDYNSKTFNLKDTNESTIVKRCNDIYTSTSEKTRYMIDFTYRDLQIKTYNVHILYVILQYIYDVTTIKELSELSWDYTQWNVKITHSKPTTKLAENMIVVQYILNRPSYGVPMKNVDLDNECPLTGRGWGGESPREVNYKFGFPLMSTKLLPGQVKEGARVILCPFPTELINPNRIAIITPGDELKCFTCGVQKGGLDKFGKTVKFERGHVEPHISGGSNIARHQCKWCNTFYKDKITWNVETNKPEFNFYAILRDVSKAERDKASKRLGYQFLKLN